MSEPTNEQPGIVGRGRRSRGGRRPPGKADRGVAARARRTAAWAAAIVTAMLLLAGPIGSARAAEPAAPSPWTLAFYKTVTYEAIANAYDLLLYQALAGAAAAPAGAFVAANLAVDSAAYYAHEMVWSRLAPVPAEGDAALRVEAEKTLSFRVVSTAGHAAVFYAFTGQPLAALGFGLAANLGEAAIYFGNEWGWRVLGPAPPAAAAAAP